MRKISEVSSDGAYDTMWCRKVLKNKKAKRLYHRERTQDIGKLDIRETRRKSTKGG